MPRRIAIGPESETSGLKYGKNKYGFEAEFIYCTC
jgi:hypothetical protein